jgi:hypothetical protein
VKNRRWGHSKPEPSSIFAFYFTDVYSRKVSAFPNSIIATDDFVNLINHGHPYSESISFAVEFRFDNDIRPTGSRLNSASAEVDQTSMAHPPNQTAHEENGQRISFHLKIVSDDAFCASNARLPNKLTHEYRIG